MKTLIYSLLGILYLISACKTEHGEHDAWLNQMDSLLWTDYKQAKDKLESMKGTVEEWGVHDQMRFWILYVDAKNKNYIKLNGEDEKRVQTSMKYYEREGNMPLQAWASYLLGSVWSDMGDGVSAIEAWRKTIEVASQNVPIDQRRIVLSYLQMAREYEKEYLCDEALEYLDSAMTHANNISAAYLKQSILTEKNTINFFLGNYDSVLTGTDAVRDLLLLDGDSSFAATCVFTALLASVEKEDTVNAMRYLTIYESSDWVDENYQIKKGTGLYYYVKGMCLLFEGNCEQARLLFEREINETGDWNNRQAAYKGLSNYYQSIGDLDSALQYARLQIEAADSSYLEQNGFRTQALKASFDYGRMQHLAKEEAERRERTTYWLFALIGISVTVIFTAIVIVQWLRNKRKQERNQVRIELARKESEIEQVTMELIQLQQSHEADLNSIAETEEKLNALTREFTKLQLNAFRHEKAIDSLWYISNDFVRNLRKKATQEKATLEELNQLQRLMMEKETVFFKKLKETAPYLTEKEVLVCLFRKLQFTNHEISSLLVLQDGSVSSMRARIFKKATNKAYGTTKDFDNWLASLDK